MNSWCRHPRQVTRPPQRPYSHTCTRLDRWQHMVGRRWSGVVLRTMPRENHQVGGSAVGPSLPCKQLCESATLRQTRHLELVHQRRLRGSAVTDQPRKTAPNSSDAAPSGSPDALARLPTVSADAWASESTPALPRLATVLSPVPSNAASWASASSTRGWRCMPSQLCSVSEDPSPEVAVTVHEPAASMPAELLSGPQVTLHGTRSPAGSAAVGAWEVDNAALCRACHSSSTASASCCSHMRAISIGRLPRKSCTLASAPASSRRWRTAPCPWRAASCAGVHPSLSFTSTPAPAPRSSLTAVGWPWRAAKWRGVRWKASLALTLAPPATSRCSKAVSPA
eukprot:scaffold83123_cov31-Tisochrysis_lutea.AAC.1